MSDKQALPKKIEAEQEKLAPAAVEMVVERGGKTLPEIAPRTQGVSDEQFPTAALGEREEKDKIMEAKLQLQTPGAPGYTAFGKLEAKDSDFEWLQRKRAAAEAANFQAWFAQEYDKMGPAQKERAKQLFPEFYAQRKKLLKKQSKNLYHLAKLKLEGPENEKDLLRLYLAENGRLDVGPLNHLLNPEWSESRDPKLQQARFQRGLLNPFRIFGDEPVGLPNESVPTVRWGQQRAFEPRNFDPEMRYLGFNNRGFPPMQSQGQQQGDYAWWRMLQTSAGAPQGQPF